MANGEPYIRISMTREQALNLLGELADMSGSVERGEMVELLGRNGIDVAPELIPETVPVPRRQAVEAARKAVEESAPGTIEAFRPPWSPPPYASVEPYKPYGSALSTLFSFVFIAADR